MNEDFRIVLEIDESDSGTTNIPLKEERLFLCLVSNCFKFK